MMNLIRMFLCVLLLAAAASADAGPREPVERRFDHEGIARRYWLYEPATPARGVVLLLHGHGGNGGLLLGRRARAAPYRAWLAIADREGLVLIAPDGARGGDGFAGWNDCRRARTN